jgi:hypothetical protein
VALQGRVLDYLHLDRFRDVLWNVHAGLRGCRTALQANNERLLILPGIREKRQEAITDFVNTLEALAACRRERFRCKKASFWPGYWAKYAPNARL